MNLLRPWHIYVENALQAAQVLQRDVDYVVVDRKVQIVDESTGRIFSDRSWRDGLHQAVEAKEQVPVEAEKVSLARITRQRYFARYELVAGMTGTAADSRREFHELYRLNVTPIPLNRPCLRQALPQRVFATAAAKWRAVADSVAACQTAGRPVLVGTRNIESSERLAAMLDARGVPYRLLNGKQDESEAQLVATAGEVGTVTIATNMAGRGTDIVPTPPALEAGGLHVIGTERHESRRIDRQLVGRAARQGQPGSYQYFISAEDDLIRRHGGGLARWLARRADKTGEVSVDVRHRIDRVQQRAEKHGFAQRKKLMQQDNWLDSVLETLAKRNDHAA